MHESQLHFHAVIAACMGYADRTDVAGLVETILTKSPSEPKLKELNDLQRTIRQLIGTQDTLDLIYGGATKIKGYVFESARLPEIRGASALLDFAGIDEVKRICGKERVIYAGGGSFLAFAPAGEGERLAREIEQRFTALTQTALSVVVSTTFHLLELRYGRLAFGADGAVTYWIDQFRRHSEDTDLQQYYYAHQKTDSIEERFYRRKNFGELVTVLATMYNRRRDERGSAEGERMLPLVERLPWTARCTSSDHRPAAYVDDIYGALSEASVRKVAVGRLVKHGEEQAVNNLCLAINWTIPNGIKARAWSKQWSDYLENEGRSSPYAQSIPSENAVSAFDTHQIGAAGGGYIGLIYADGNNVGRQIATLQTPGAYAKFSKELEDAARKAVFEALAKHLTPAHVVDEQGKLTWCHPFEILTIGGDDLFLIVPGNKALEIALSIGVAFERQLGEPTPRMQSGRYHGEDAQNLLRFTPEIGLSAGLVIAQADAPIFFLQQLVEELLKSAKKVATAEHGGAIDFMVLKSVTMVSDNIREFRRAAFEGQQCRLTARPYAWYEFAGLLTTLRALKQAGAPRSQLYRLREVLLEARDQGPQSSALEYLYTRTRQNLEVGGVWQKHIEQHWRNSALPNGMPPWMARNAKKTESKWETIWADLVELYDMLKVEEEPAHA
jgi:CRISPR-associated protein Cmr2